MMDLLPPDLLPPFPTVLDSSMRSAFVSCPRNFYYSYMLSLRKASGSIHLHFGGCVAKALEVTRKAYYSDGLTEINAVGRGCTAFIQAWGDYELDPTIENTRAGIKTLDAGLDAIVSYFEEYPLGSDQIKPLMIADEPMVEKSFCLPIPNTQHPLTGEPVGYCGRFDMLATYDNAIFVVDEKTATALGSAWRSNWPMRGQITGYCWGARSYGLNVSGAIIRGIGIMKQSIQFEQAVLSRPDWQVDQWLEQLTRDVNRAVDMWKRAQHMPEFAELPHNAWDQALDSACSSYGGCGYVGLCDSPDPRRWYSEFIVSPWDPLTRQEDAA